jgi:hypothetical protein
LSQWVNESMNQWFNPLTSTALAVHGCDLNGPLRTPFALRPLVRVQVGPPGHKLAPDAEVHSPAPGGRALRPEAHVPADERLAALAQSDKLVNIDSLSVLRELLARGLGPADASGEVAALAEALWTRIEGLRLDRLSAATLTGVERQGTEIGPQLTSRIPH